MYVPQSLLASKATSKELRAAIEAHAELVERDRLQVRRVHEAEYALEVTAAAEPDAEADAVSRHEPMPPSELGEQRAELEEMRREAAALEHAVRNARVAVADAIAANRPAWAKAHAGESDRRREELVAAVDAFVEADRRLRDAYAVDAFLGGGE
jgi:hypothetical protein